jgi:hypothetical protein
MATYATVIPSGLTDGVPLVVTATTSGAAHTVHTCHATLHDEVWVYAANDHASTDRVLTVEIGGTSDPIVVTIPFRGGFVEAVPGIRLTNSTTVKVFADGANDVRVAVNVNRITN